MIDILKALPEIIDQNRLDRGLPELAYIPPLRASQQLTNDVTQPEAAGKQAKKFKNGEFIS